MARVRQVIDLVTHPGCSSRELARHFGDEDTVPTDGCRHCNFCLSNTPVKFLQARDHLSRKGRIDEKKVKAILAATDVRDDARFLARVAFGISSPRVTTERLGKHDVFGSMDDCDFEVSWYSFTGWVCERERGGPGRRLVVSSLTLTICFLRYRSSSRGSQKPALLETGIFPCWRLDPDRQRMPVSGFAKCSYFFELYHLPPPSPPLLYSLYA